MEYTLPPYTLEERSREVQMRMKALYWRLRHKLKRKMGKLHRNIFIGS